MRIDKLVVLFLFLFLAAGCKESGPEYVSVPPPPVIEEPDKFPRISDEELLTLVQTGKTRKMPIILVHEPFWRGLLAWFEGWRALERDA